jgi:hypothetical protein
MFGTPINSAFAGEPGHSSFLFFPSYIFSVYNWYKFPAWWILTRFDWTSTNLLTFASARPFIIILKTDFPRSVFFNLCTRVSPNEVCTRYITVYQQHVISEEVFCLFAHETHQVLFRVADDITLCLNNCVLSIQSINLAIYVGWFEIRSIYSIKLPWCLKGQFYAIQWLFRFLCQIESLLSKYFSC